jgi:hypothetical protein
VGQVAAIAGIYNTLSPENLKKNYLVSNSIEGKK